MNQDKMHLVNKIFKNETIRNRKRIIRYGAIYLDNDNAIHSCFWFCSGLIGFHSMRHKKGPDLGPCSFVAIKQ